MRFNTVGLFGGGWFNIYEVYPNKSKTTHTLKEEIERCVNEIYPYLCKTVMGNFDKSVYVPGKPWRPLTRYAMPYIILYCILWINKNITIFN